jgi:hypothetical protein
VCGLECVDVMCVCVCVCVSGCVCAVAVEGYTATTPPPSLLLSPLSIAIHIKHFRMNLGCWGKGGRRFRGN